MRPTLFTLIVAGICTAFSIDPSVREKSARPRPSSFRSQPMEA